MAVNVLGIVSIVVFYLLILAVGMIAARKTSSAQRQEDVSETETIMLAGRNIGWLIGTFTMTATWVGGGYINGTAEAVFDGGLLWAQPPWGYALSLIVGGFLFARIMRDKGYITMLDPFQDKYGARIGGLMYIPALCGEIFWSAAILGALGSCLRVILDISDVMSIIISTAIAIAYTLVGGLYSVAYTDVIQLICIFVGLWICVPFALTNENVGNISVGSADWLGTWDKTYAGQWFDFALLLIFGGIPWQVYFQRVLSSKSSSYAQFLSYAAAVGCVVMAIPAVLVGAIAATTDWDKTNYGHSPDTKDEKKLVLPLVLQYLTPPAIQFIGLGAVSAAVMSSADSSVLSASTMFAHNIYKLVFRPKATDFEIITVMRVSIFLVGAVAAGIAIKVDSIYELWFLCSDFVYCILFPQLLCVVYFRASNTYGCLAGYIMALFLRLGGGETTLAIPAFIEYPYYTNGEQLFPFRTLAMTVSLGTIILVSLLFQLLFFRGYLPVWCDVFHNVVNLLDPMETEPVISNEMMGNASGDIGVKDVGLELLNSIEGKENKSYKNSIQSESAVIDTENIHLNPNLNEDYPRNFR